MISSNADLIQKPIHTHPLTHLFRKYIVHLLCVRPCVGDGEKAADLRVSICENTQCGFSKMRELRPREVERSREVVAVPQGHPGGEGGAGLCTRVTSCRT